VELSAEFALTSVGGAHQKCANARLQCNLSNWRLISHKNHVCGSLIDNSKMVMESHCIKLLNLTAFLQASAVADDTNVIEAINSRTSQNE
jgi:hypothetical protein